MKKILTCEDVGFAYKGEECNALENINFSVYEHDFLAIIGPNGGGKTTLIKLLVGLLQPTQGKILYPNPNILNQHSLVGYVPQDTNLNMDFPIRVLDVVLMGFLKPKILGFRPSKAQLKQAFETLEMLEMHSFAYEQLHVLSGGQRQRVLIARALCGAPKLLVLDEPTSSIDMKMQMQIYKSLKKINQFHTIIVISHHISVLLGYANRALFVNKEVSRYTVLKQGIVDVPKHNCEIDLFDVFYQLKENE